jgi:hypothetical protein
LNGGRINNSKELRERWWKKRREGQDPGTGSRRDNGIERREIGNKMRISRRKRKELG